MDRERLERLLRVYLQTGDSRPIHQLFDELVQPNTSDTAVPSAISPTLETPTLDMPTMDFDEATVDFDPSHDLSREFDDATIDYSPDSDNTTDKSVARKLAEQFGEYQTQSVLGEGGMGAVMRVRDPYLRRSVALKVMHNELGEDPFKRRAFVEEAQISAQLQHPGIVPVYDFSTLPNGKMFFTMQEVQGQTLHEVIQGVHRVSEDGLWRVTEDGWSLRRLIGAFHSVCETMAYAHAKGVIHRDLKPANIMVGDFGEVLVVDWGIAKIVPPAQGKHEGSLVEIDPRSIPEVEGIVGSPSYMSPEQARGDAIDARSDVYSLGVILYRILSGRSPYSGSVLEIVAQKQAAHSISLRTLDSPQSPAVVAPSNSKPCNEERHLDEVMVEQLHASQVLSLPNELVEICEKALQYHVADRYQSAMELAQEIQAWLDGAQRREKALAILDQVHALQAEIKRLKTVAQTSWQRANQEFSSHGLTSDTGMSAYEAFTEANEMIRELQYEIQQQLQGAIVYDPELVEAHRLIVELEYHALMDALLHIDKRAERTITRKIRIHLERLPKREQQYWHAKKNKDIGAFHMLRKRRGTFVGRLAQMAQIEGEVQGGRCLSLIGTAGVGKTHLALEAASKWRIENNAETIFCDLTAAKDRLSIVQEMAKALQLSLGQEDPIKSIGKALESRAAIMLVLDNVEQIVNETGDVLRELFACTTHFKVLVTSRIRLSIPQEVVIRIEPMSLLEGVELFVLRAQQVRPDFAMDSANREAIGRIVQGLDLLPLAMELAAARISTLSLQQIETRLSERFDLLRGRLRDPHQRALQAALDWSWGLLSPEGQSVLMQCSVFQSGFDILAAEKILDLSEFTAAPNVIDVIEALYDDNLLLKTQQEDGQFRYSMLVSIHAYAAQKREVNQSTVKGLQHVYQRHAQYYGALSVELRDDVAAFSRLITTELENLIVGIQFGAVDAAFLCCQAAMRYFHFNGPMVRGIEVSERYLDRKGLMDEQRIPIFLARLTCLRVSGAIEQARQEMDAHLPYGELSLSLKPLVVQDKQAAVDSTITESEVADSNMSAEVCLERGLLEQAQAHYPAAISWFTHAHQQYEREGDDHGVCTALLQLGKAYLGQGNAKRALEYLEPAYEIACQVQELELQAMLLSQRGSAYRDLGDYTEANQYFESAVTMFRAQQNLLEEGTCLGLWGLSLQDGGQFEEALVIMNESLRIAIQTEDKLGEARNYTNIGIVQQNLVRHEEAKASFHESLRIARELGHPRGEVVTGCNLGNLALQVEQWHEANEHFEYALRIARTLGDQRTEGMLIGNMGVVQQGLGNETAALRLFEESLQLAQTIGNKRNEGLNHGCIAEILEKQGNFELAKQHYQQAIQLNDISRPVEAGICRAYLARLLAKENQIGEALILLRQAEPQVHPKPSEHCSLLCIKTEIIYRTGQQQPAKKLFEQAQSLHTRYRFRPSSTIRKRLAEVRELLNEPQPDQSQQLLLSAKVFLERGEIERLQSRAENAIDVCQCALELYQLIDHQEGACAALRSIGNIYWDQGKAHETLYYYQQAIEIARTLDDIEAMGVLSGGLANVHQVLGQVEQAIVHYQEALDVVRLVKNVRREGSLLNNLGLLYQYIGRYDEAMVLFQESMRIANQTQDKSRMGRCQATLGLAHEAKGDYTAAIRCHLASVDIAKEMQDVRNEGIYLGNLGQLYLNIERYEDAKQTLSESIAIAKQVQDHYTQGYANAFLGEVYYALGDIDTAIQLYQSAIDVSDGLVPRATDIARGYLALALATKGQFDAAQALLDLVNPEIQSNPVMYSLLLCKRAEIAMLKEDMEQARQYVEAGDGIAQTHTLSIHSRAMKCLERVRQKLISSS